MVPNCDAHLLQGGCGLKKETCPSDITFFREFIQIQNLQILENRRQQFRALRMNPNLQYISIIKDSDLCQEQGTNNQRGLLKVNYLLT
ncbi:Os02g0825367 [Oryza sativa Japonica Group]|uniref:Os02g0825367 protein n=1 Tax=Oryza sativa subsp. japonica TaxID=39947 RepID=A0A0P0VRG6_ORYSJ|nr:hypothetical protein EE612_014582 [Oryza sativa]BAS81678.1 Os02g0825367 [Oryza sativa Japonica Group]